MLKYVNETVLKTLKEGPKSHKYTYKELCELGVFSEYVKGGNVRKAQMDELRSCCEIVEQGGRGKYVIKNFYDTPINLIASGMYQEDIQPLILNMLAKSLEQQQSDNSIIKEEGDYKSIQIIETPTDLAIKIGMVNENFKKINHAFHNGDINSMEALAKRFGNNVSISCVLFVLGSVKELISKNLLSALKSMERRTMIAFEIRYRVAKKTQDGNIIYEFANEEEIDFMEKCMRETCRELYISGEDELMYRSPNKKKDYERILKSKYAERNIEYFYKVYSIHSSDETVKRGMKRILSERKEKEIKNSLNDKCIEGVTTKNNNKIESIEEKEKKVIGKKNYKKGLKKEISEDKVGFQERSNKVTKDIVNIRSKKKL